MHWALSQMGAGATVTLRRRVTTANPMGGSPTITDTNTTVTAAMFRYRQKDIGTVVRTQSGGATVVEAEDRVCYISALELASAGVTPTDNDQIIDGTDVFNIIRLQPNQPGNEEVYWKAILRR